MVMDVCEEEWYVRAQGGVHRYGCVCERSRRMRDTLAYRVVYIVMDVCVRRSGGYVSVQGGVHGYGCVCVRCGEYARIYGGLYGYGCVCVRGR